MSITAIHPEMETDEDAAVLAASDFNSGVGFFGYDAELTTNHAKQREIVVRYDGETLAVFTEDNPGWLDDLESYGYRLTNGAMAA